MHETTTRCWHTASGTTETVWPRGPRAGVGQSVTVLIGPLLCRRCSEHMAAFRQPLTMALVTETVVEPDFTGRWSTWQGVTPHMVPYAWARKLALGCTYEPGQTRHSTIASAVCAAPRSGCGLHWEEAAGLSCHAHDLPVAVPGDMLTMLVLR